MPFPLKLEFVITFVFADSDECAANSHNCHDDAMCMNTQGGYECTCNAGYRGNGVLCKGKHF